MHVDFMRVGEGATIRVRIPVHVLNADQSPGVKRGGAVNIVNHTIEVVCPADAIPEIDRRRHLRASRSTTRSICSDVDAAAECPGGRQGDMTLVTVVPPSGYAEEMKAAAEAPLLLLLPRLPRLLPACSGAEGAAAGALLPVLRCCCWRCCACCRAAPKADKK